MAAARTDDKPVDGMLLYASTGHEFSFKYVIDGHRIQARSLNLDQDWQGIRADLLEAACGLDASSWNAPSSDVASCVG